MESPTVTVWCRLGASWLCLGCSTTEHVLSSVRASRGAHSLSLSLFCFLLPHPRGCRTTDNTRTKHSRCSTVRQSTKPFDCVSTLTDAVAPTRCMIRTGHVNTSNHTGRYQYVWKIMENGHKGIKYSLHFPYILVLTKTPSDVSL